MTPWDLFKIIKNTKHEEYREAGDHVNWIVRVDHDEKAVRLYFEESHGKRDWLNNLAFPVKPYKKQVNTLWVAHGWCNAYKSCNNEIQNDFIQNVNKYPEYQAEICGWSYGGAMAVLASEDFYFRTKIKPIVTTFGAPKPIFGKKSWKHIRDCVASINQYADVNDCVTFMPPFPGYKHIRKLKVGKRKFNLIEWFKPKIYHTTYDEKDVYFKF